MEKGKIYEVYYKDDTQSRHKTLKFQKKDETFVYFFNELNGNEEIIPKVSIIRISRNKDEKTKSSLSAR
ncbi:MAG: hypothetical protein ACOC5T_08475 [Elusimicrobiota bacterium]